MKRAFRVLSGVALAGLMIAAAEGRSIPGTATLSGTVDSSKPFKAAQVYIRNLDKNMLYMVYTSGGRYRAIDLFPGQYELSVKAKDLESDVQKLNLKAGQTAMANLSLRESKSDNKDVIYQSFDEIYPQGEGLTIAKRTCISCHGPNFLPSKHWGPDQWNAAIDFMRGNESRMAFIKPEDMSPQDRETIVAYLAKNFGPGSQTRAVNVPDMPVDETKIGKAMYVEFYLPKDGPDQGINAPEYKGLASPFGHRRVGQDVHFDTEGNVWLTDRGIPNRLVRLNPRTGELKDYLTPNPKSGNHDLNIDKNGIIWLTEHQGVEGGAPKYLNGFNPKTEKWEYRYQLDPDGTLKMPQKWAQSLAIDSKGNIFVGWMQGSALSKWDRETKKVSVFPLPTPNAFTYGVVRDKNDNIWVAEFYSSKFAKFDTKTNKFTEYTPPTHPVMIRRLSVDSQNNVWVGLYSAGKILKLDQTTDKMTEYKIPHTISQPYDVQEHDGMIWISDAGQGGTIIKFNPQDQSFTYYVSPQRADKPKIQITRDGAIWYSPRSSAEYPGIGVLYPDMDKIASFAAYY